MYHPVANRLAPGRWARRLAIALPVIIALVPVLVVAVAAVVLRHVPLDVTALVGAEHRPVAAAPAGAAPAGGLRLRYLGISGYELTDGTTVVLLDPQLTRPTLGELLTGPIAPDEALIAAWIGERVDYILVNHAHYDHAMDAPAIALRTGAVIIGSRSSRNLALARGVPPSQVREVRHGDALTLGTLEVRVGSTAHSPLLGITDPMPGVIPADAGELWFWQYTQDGTLTYAITRRDTGRAVLFHPSSAYRPPPGTGHVDVVIFGLAGRALTAATVAAIHAAHRPDFFLPTHYDNFLQPLSRGPSLLPVIDFDAVASAFAEGAPGVPWYLLAPGEAVDAGVALPQGGAPR